MEQSGRVTQPGCQRGLLPPTVGLVGEKVIYLESAWANICFVLFGSVLLCKGTPGGMLNVVIETDAGGSASENLKPVPRQPGLEGRSTETNLIPVLTETCPLGFSKSHCVCPLFLENVGKTAPSPMKKEGRRSHHKWIGGFRNPLSSASGKAKQAATRNRPCKGIKLSCL